MILEPLRLPLVPPPQETDGRDGWELGSPHERLDEVGYVEVTKEFVDDKPVTWYALTPPGKKALEAHLSALDGLIRRGVRTG